MKRSILQYANGLLKRTALSAQDAWDRLSRRSTPRLVLRRLNAQALSFFERKAPMSDKYPYEVHFAPALQNVPEGLDAFHLVGRNWRRNPHLPVALAFGFNAWKYGFIADYCQDVRIAFAPRKFLGRKSRRVARRLKPAPERILVWGYTDPRWIARLARKRGIPLVRVEDAFLRSADLGANHATPYSLVFDTKGLYYNTSEPNDLADILAHHDFAADRALMEDAERARRLIVDNGLSKYNLPDTTDPARRFRVKTRRRVVVIGQVDNDAAVRMGNPGGWRIADIIRLARLENPDAEILYRPHPEVYRGFQRTRFKAALVANIAEIVPPDGSLVDLLRTTDQVYTISSLSGLEALIRGVKVTTLGTPFYAGWGPTDDRNVAPKGRVLTPLEIFAAAYLLYPRYLADPAMPLLSVASSALRIMGERAKLALEANVSSREQISVKRRAIPFRSVQALLVSDDAGEDVAATLLKRSGEVVDLFRTFKGVECHRVILTLIAARVQDDDILFEIINRAIGVADTKASNAFLIDLHRHRRSASLAKLFSVMVGSSPAPLEALSTYRALRVEAPNLAVMDDPDQATAKFSDTVEDATRLRELGELYSEAVKLREALDCFHEAMIVSGISSLPVEQIAETARSVFDYQSAYWIAKLYMSAKGTAPAWCLRTVYLTGAYVADENLVNDAVLYCTERPSVTPVMASRLTELGVLESHGFSEKALLNTISLVHEERIPFVHALMELGKFDEALDTANAIAARDQSYQSAILISKALCFLDRYEEAERLIDSTLQYHKIALVYDEALKICLYLGNYEKAEYLLTEAQSLSIDAGEVLPRKIRFGQRRIREAFETFQTYHFAGLMQRAYPESYVKFNGERSKNSVLVLPIFGPGDEIRFASIYSMLSGLLKHERIYVGCEPRLLSLFKRSFASFPMEFVPVARLLRQPLVDLTNYENLPTNELMPALDNNAHARIGEQCEVVLATDLLAGLLPNYDAFPRRPYLTADKRLSAVYEGRMPRACRLVGLNWRSSITHQTRSEHYLSIEDLLPLFDRTDVRFVNLQYDECADELEFIEKRYPGRLINLPDLDQYNDFEGVAALMSVLDLVIAPCTAVAELAGALGRPTWLLANSSETRWRVVDDRGGDVWHGTMKHIEGTTFRNKRSLVEVLSRELAEWDQQAQFRYDEAI